MYYSANYYCGAAINAIKAHGHMQRTSPEGSPLKSAPLFMYYAIQNVHSPYTLPPSWEVNAYPKIWDNTYANMLHMMDSMVGNVTDALKDEDMW